MSDIVEFLRARLDEDERAARFVTSDYANHKAEWTELSSGVLDIGDELVPMADSPLSRYIAHFDPARTLREVAAKRETLAKYEYAIEALHDDDHPSADWYYIAIGDAVAALLTVYSDHPDYREGWKP